MKNIIFDVGDVLIGYRWQDMLAEFGLEPEKADEMGNALFHNGMWNLLDNGTLTLTEAKERYKKELPQFRDAIEWFLTNMDRMPVKRPDVWEYLPRLKEAGYKMYLLSNYAEELFTEHTKGAPFLDLVDGGVISYQVHCIKPDPGIYEALFQKYQLKPEECLFFDDRLDNVEAGRAAGMQAIQVTGKEQLKEELQKLL